MQNTLKAFGAWFTAHPVRNTLILLVLPSIINGCFEGLSEGFSNSTPAGVTEPSAQVSQPTVEIPVETPAEPAPAKPSAVQQYRDYWQGGLSETDSSNGYLTVHLVASGTESDANITEFCSTLLNSSRTEVRQFHVDNELVKGSGTPQQLETAVDMSLESCQHFK